MSTLVQTATLPHSRKLSRYRSVRNAASDDNSNPSPALPRQNPPESGPMLDDGCTTGESRGRLAGPTSPPRPIMIHEASLDALEGRTNRTRTDNDTRATAEAQREEHQVQHAHHLPDRGRRRLSSSKYRGSESTEQELHRSRPSSDVHRSESATRHTRRSLVKRPPVMPENDRLAIASPSVRPSKKEPYMTGALPVDIPISAGNAGDRKVTVLWNDDMVELTVTHDTTARQLIAATCAQLSRPNSERLILLESFSQLGLDRPIRRYEHIRDIMDSWDRDDLNVLEIKPKDEDARASGLSTIQAPSRRPGACSVKMYHSQRPGKWDKKHITLDSNGQMTMAKKEGSETVNVCHLSDFDVYVPTKRQLSEKIRPPRKCCLAVKSQQKPSILIDGANFVHFFSTNDQDLASTWYYAIQDWRSWYLYDTLATSQQNGRRSNSVGQRSVLQEYGIAPLLGRINLSAPVLGKHKYKNGRYSSHSRDMPPSSFPTGFNISSPTITNTGVQQNTKGTPSALSNLPSSLPIRAPSTHKNAGTSNLPNNLPIRVPSTRGHAGASGIISPPATPNTTSTTKPRRLSFSWHQSSPPKSPPKTLIDVTPQYQEPPQHQRKGRGLIPNLEPGKHLIGPVPNANTSTSAVQLPSTTTFRRSDQKTPSQSQSQFQYPSSIAASLFSRHRRRSTSLSRPQTQTQPQPQPEPRPIHNPNHQYQPVFSTYNPSPTNPQRPRPSSTFSLDSHDHSLRGYGYGPSHGYNNVRRPSVLT